jgi:arsenite methyltransferase
MPDTKGLTMPGSKPDIWSEWLLRRRDGGDPQQIKLTTAYLRPVRDKVLGNANLSVGETLLDVGCGDGLIAFGALEKCLACKVIFSDVSQELLERSQTIARELELLDRCQFLKASAGDLTVLNDGTVDVVTTRSVLIYVSDKQQAFDEFYRVLKPGGRLSIFEPINRFGYPPPENTFFGYDVTGEITLAKKVQEVYNRAEAPGTDSMLDFGEYDLIAQAERAGFKEIHLDLQIEIKPFKMEVNFERALHISPNPFAPTLEEAINEALTPGEAERFTSFLRKTFEEEQGVRKKSAAYLWAVKR